ncbi:MAG: hypothetical protein ABJA20_09870 [Novosphingobium sp.]
MHTSRPAGPQRPSQFPNMEGPVPMTKPRPTLFLIAAFWNWAIAISTVIAPALVYQLTMPIPAPANLAMTYLFMGLVLVFGIGYFWAWRDFTRNASVIRLGVVGKLTVFVISAIAVLTGQIGMLLFVVATGDFIFALLFLRALNILPNSETSGTDQ